MEKKEIRTLRADEIECKIQTNPNGAVILALYKDARVDMRLLDECYGSMNWKRSHEIINGNLFCTISIWDEDKKEWVSKQDVGTESNVEKEKGEASDSFKRAGFNWGIGRELYTAPFLYIKLNDSEQEKNGKVMYNVKFSVKSIGYNELNEIDHIIIVDNNNVIRKKIGLSNQEKRKEAWDYLEQNQAALTHYLKTQNVSDITNLNLVKVYNNLKINKKI